MNVSSGTFRGNSMACEKLVTGFTLDDTAIQSAKNLTLVPTRLVDFLEFTDINFWKKWNKVYGFWKRNLVVVLLSNICQSGCQCANFRKIMSGGHANVYWLWLLFVLFKRSSSKSANAWILKENQMLDTLGLTDILFLYSTETCFRKTCCNSCFSPRASATGVSAN